MYWSRKSGTERLFAFKERFSLFMRRLSWQTFGILLRKVEKKIEVIHTCIYHILHNGKGDRLFLSSAYMMHKSTSQTSCCIWCRIVTFHWTKNVNFILALYWPDPVINICSFSARVSTVVLPFRLRLTSVRDLKC